ncbi:MAG: hypothetical protein MSG64_11950 [Pyrinomonadaceae bacterium MAG19_C2-C3]|nr:hypothetical protein [Pyrinomonadaceae bacterium MAG19_C2-C3]
MNEDTTQDLNRLSFEERVLAEFAAMHSEIAAMRADIAVLHKVYFRLDERLSTLEEKVDRRLQETRPIWENVLAEVKHANKKLDILAAATLRDVNLIRYARQAYH